MKRIGGQLPHWPPRLPGFWHGLTWTVLSKLLLLFGATGVMTLLIVQHLDIYQIGTHLEQIRAGQPSPRDITANTTLRIVDTEETQRQRDVAASRVPVVFTEDARAQANAQADLDLIFAHLLKSTLATTDLDAVDLLKVPRTTAMSVHALTPETRQRLHLACRLVVADVLRTRIEQGVSEGKAGEQATTLLAARIPDATQAALAQIVVRAVLRPNWLKDDARTLQRQEEARLLVAEVTRTYKRGDIIIHTGETISPEVLMALKENGLLAVAPLERLLPVCGLVLLAFIALGIYLRGFAPLVYANNTKLLLLAILIVTPVWAYMTFSPVNEYLVGMLTVPAAAMAIAGLLSVPIAIVAAVLTAIAAGLTSDHQYAVVVLTLGSSMAGLVAIATIWPARRAPQGVATLLGINLMLMLSIEGLQPGNGFSTLWHDLMTTFLWACAGGLGAFCFAVGAIYFLARPFGSITHFRLMELSNPNEALLRRLLTEAPGTYHSCVMVANMAEAASDAIGANALLTRVAALYHDIGKLKRPAFFVENQAPLGIEENVHQRLAPKLSFLILAGHVRDGVELGRRSRLPDEVVRIISEHHGTTLAAYFYHRARNENPRGDVVDHEFRYAGPRPSTRESAVVMLADSVQASVKSLKDPTPVRIEHMVREIIRNRLDDGQFSECDITLGDLQRISNVFMRMLSGLYTYTRIEYPDTKGEGTRLRANVNSEPAAPAS